MSTSPEEQVEEFAGRLISWCHMSPTEAAEFWANLATAFAENAKGEDVYPCGYCEEEFESEEEREEHMAECPDHPGRGDH